jgi:hypothetical protein
MLGGEVWGGAAVELIWIWNGLSSAIAVPSLTAMAMAAVMPISEVPGVPVKRPVVALNVAHDGSFVILNVSGAPLVSEALGWNEYAVPTIAVVDGEPAMVGGAETVEVTPSTFAEVDGASLLPPHPAIAPAPSAHSRKPLKVFTRPHL